MTESRRRDGGSPIETVERLPIRTQHLEDASHADRSSGRVLSRSAGTSRWRFPGRPFRGITNPRHPAQRDLPWLPLILPGISVFHNTVRSDVLLVGGKKIAGILAEIQADLDQLHFLVIGVGLNVNHMELPADLADRATSLRLASGHPQSRIEILVDFLEEFETLLDRFHAEGPGVIVSEWSRHSSFANGRHVEIGDGMRTVKGVTRGLNSIGALRIETADQRIEEIYSGEVRGNWGR